MGLADRVPRFRLASLREDADRFAERHRVKSEIFAAIAMRDGAAP